MAKSLRSKWRRKCRAVKRERYQVKELERLKKTLGIVENSNPSDVQMEPVADIVTITNIKDKISKKKEINKTQDAETPNKETEVEEMDTNKVVRVYNKRTMRDQFGNYPPWMSKRSIRDKKRLKKGKKPTKK